MRTRALLLILIVIALAAAACRQKQQGTIEGTVLPPGAAATVTVLQQDRTVGSVRTAGDGRFRFELAPGAYRLSAAAGTVRRSIDNVSVRTGERILLPPIDLAAAKGAAVLSGRVICPEKACEVALIQEGVERAAVQAGPEGRYEFKELPAGEYTVVAKAPGHAADSARVAVPGEGAVRQDVLLLPISSQTGVDWAAGTIRATGIGLPPKDAANPTVRRAMAQRAALADGERNLLRQVEEVRLDGTRTVKEAMADRAVTVRITGFLRGYRVVTERDLDGGKVEVVLEVPLNGPAGLTRILAE